jgi:5-methylthioribose kinase
LVKIQIDFFKKLFCINEKWFYICTRDSKGALAQLVEQWTENPCVPGSIPGGTTTKKTHPNFS